MQDINQAYKYLKSPAGIFEYESVVKAYFALVQFSLVYNNDTHTKLLRYTSTLNTYNLVYELFHLIDKTFTDKDIFEN